MFTSELKQYNKKIKNLDVIFYMIVELVWGCIYNSIIIDIPLPFNEYNLIYLSKFEKWWKHKYFI